MTDIRVRGDKYQGCPCAEERPGEDTAGRQPSASQRDVPRRNPHLLCLSDWQAASLSLVLPGKPILITICFQFVPPILHSFCSLLFLLRDYFLLFYFFFSLEVKHSF